MNTTISHELEEFSRIYGGTNAPTEMIEAFMEGVRFGRQPRQNRDNGGGPAFPHSVEGYSGMPTTTFKGMTLRDYFAAHAPEPNAEWVAAVSKNDPSRVLAEIVKAKYEYADAMLAERIKE